MQKFLLILSFCASAYLANAQDSTATPKAVYKNSVRIAVEAVSPTVSLQQTPGLKYSALYTRQLTNSRWLFEGSLGYINYYKNQQFSPFDYYFKGDRSQRIVAELDVFFNVLTHNRHAVRLGAGPSVWYQRDGMVDDLTGVVSGKLQRVESISFSRVYASEVNVGLNLRGYYDFNITSRAVLGANVSVVNNLLSSHAEGPLVGTLVTAGLHVGYRF